MKTRDIKIVTDVTEKVVKVKKNTYITSDNKEFSTEASAMSHQSDLDFNKVSVGFSAVTLKDWIQELVQLKEQYGEDAELSYDAGYNNVDFEITHKRY